jgi:hypothetical protein
MKNALFLQKYKNFSKIVWNHNFQIVLYNQWFRDNDKVMNDKNDKEKKGLS